MRAEWRRLDRESVLSDSERLVEDRFRERYSVSEMDDKVRSEIALPEFMDVAALRSRSARRRSRPWGFGTRSFCVSPDEVDVEEASETRDVRAVEVMVAMLVSVARGEIMPDRPAMGEEMAVPVRRCNACRGESGIARRFSGEPGISIPLSRRSR